ncbi:glycosyltransferase family 2 protein [Phaeobacter gallaeciensis]|uniref:glycosyltransferase family 2 protein n=1 Tax=Phaeobacter gallaeciensis TaxID=60890 RepID=UPI000BBBF368|nr:glycosyltransferase [Phaeobacter gallaeciensis]ATF18305.1 glycosyl transferase-like protein [Phaeobacter gallaeciensis]ATF22414.1 glycosyl transferase-like protein [Phaeobacter gallaeciensis]
MPAITLCIPAYAMGGDGARYLADSFDHLCHQSFSDFDIVVSDQSDDMAVAEVCRDYADRLTIIHLWNREGLRQASANVNNAMAHAAGDIIKVLFQDDLIIDPKGLAHIHDAMGQGADWCLCGSGVTRDGSSVTRPMRPRLTDRLHFGKNTVSSPSVLAMRRTSAMEFDEALIWLMDVDLYKRLWDAYGDPVVVPDTVIANRMHEGQVSASVSKALRQKELRYMGKKFARTTNLRGWLEYFRQRLKAI